MEQIYGALTPFTVMLVVTLLTQWVKNSFALTERQVQLVALGFSMILVVLYQTLTAWPNITPLGVFAAFIYGFLGWFSAIGMYEAATKQLRSREP